MNTTYTTTIATSPYTGPGGSAAKKLDERNVAEKLLTNNILNLHREKSLRFNARNGGLYY